MVEIDRAAQENEQALGVPVYEQMIYTEAQVQSRTEEMAVELRERYRGENPLFVCLMRGGVPFTADLMKAIARQDPHFHPEVDYMTIRTYGNLRTPKSPRIVHSLAPSTKVSGRRVVAIDDILDTGVTADFFRKKMELRQAVSVDLVVLVQKTKPPGKERLAWPEASLYGFKMADSWLTGEGMDDKLICKEANRWMGGLAIALSNEADSQ